jgi:hypothetical protein
VIVTSGAAAASTNDSRRGLRARNRSSTILTSWYVPGVPKPPSQKYTSSPARNRVTPGPVLSTIPAPSAPSTTGSDPPIAPSARCL